MNTVCYICLGPVSDNLSLIPCNHCFCQECIRPWLRNSRTCPTCCRVVQGHEHNENIEQESKNLVLCANECGEYLSQNEIEEHNQSCINKRSVHQVMTIADVLTKIEQGFMTESISFLTSRIKNTTLSLNERCQAKYILIRIYKKLGLYQKALDSLESCEDLSKTIRLFHLAEIHRKLEDFDESEINYTKLLELEPEHALAYRGLALINKKRRNYNDALTQIEIALSKVTQNSQQVNILRVDRADIYRKMARYHDAHKELLVAITDQDSRSKLTGLEKADALYSFVVLYLDQQKTDESTLKFLDEAQSLYQFARCDIKLAMCDFLYGRIDLQFRRFDDCFDHFSKGIKYFEKNNNHSLELADAYCDYASSIIYSTSTNKYTQAKQFINLAKHIYADKYKDGHDKIQLCDNLLILLE